MISQLVRVYQKLLSAARDGNVQAFKDVARTVDDGSGLRQALSAVKDGNGRGPCTSLPVVDVRSFVNTWLIS